MKTVKLSLETAVLLYKEGGASKAFALENYTERELNKNIFETVNTIEQVYERLGRYMPQIEDYGFLPIHQQEKALNRQYIEDIAELFNEGWKADFSNRNQAKYYNYFEYKNNTLLGFCRSVGYGDTFYSSVGLYKDYATAQHCGKKFLHIYSKTVD